METDCSVACRVSPPASPPDIPVDWTKEQKSEFRQKESMRFITCANDTFGMWNEEQFAIPNHISNAAGALILIALGEQKLAFQYLDPFVAPSLMTETERIEFLSRRTANADKFGQGAMDLLDMMRKHLQSEAKAEQMHLSNSGE